MKNGQFLLSGPEDAFRNMAIDAALLQRGKPTLRLYQWKTPTLSLGYFQPFPADLEPYITQFPEVQIVRRMTGGGAILHYQELTFSFVLPFSESIPKSIEKNYQMMNQLLIDSFQELGYSLTPRAGLPQEKDFFCYQRHHPFDLMWKDKKLIGCAQRRTQTALLHHGSIPLAKNPIEPSWNYLNEPGFEKQWEPALLKHCQKILGISFDKKPLENSLSASIEEFTQKYRNPTFLKKRSERE